MGCCTKRAKTSVGRIDMNNRLRGLSRPASHCRRAVAGGRGLDLLDLCQQRRQPLCQARRRGLSLLGADVRSLVTCAVRLASQSACPTPRSVYLAR